MVGHQINKMFLNKFNNIFNTKMNYVNKTTVTTLYSELPEYQSHNL